MSFPNFRKEKLQEAFKEASSSLKSLIRNRRGGPKNTEINGSIYTIDHWLEDSITKKQIEYYEYSDFKNKRSMRDRNVVRADWKNNIFALKSFKNDEETQRKVIDELKLRLKINRHDNILHFYGLTKLETDIVQKNKYILVLEYADSDTLNTYLDKHFDELNWNDKLDLAIQLASAVKHLHDNNIIHRDLHDNNILVHKKIIKLANFGASKVSKFDNTFELFSMMPYTDPKDFYSKGYELNNKSDVYSIGMLLWQISSGCRPLRAEAYNANLVLAIIHGRREKIIDGTPEEYSNLYTACWSYEPDERPDIHKVVSTLCQLKSSFFISPRKDDPDDDQEENRKAAIKWIEESLEKEKVKFIPFNELKNPKLLNKGGFGSIIRAIYTKTDRYVVYKKLTDEVYFKYRKLDAFVHELQINLRLTCSDRIVRCLGISKDAKEYLLVMQYADGGDLRNYLKSKFRNLTWDDKKNLASQIAEGLNYLHNEGVLHKDLHSRNIVVHENNAKITDFNISKIQDQMSPPFYEKNCGVTAYKEPKRFLDPKFQHTKSSDIYSFGVIMWEISSGYPPFKDIDSNDNATLALSISDGLREDTIPETPKEYEELYKICWDQEPEQRPIIRDVLNELTKMDFGFNTNIRLTEEPTEVGNLNSDLNSDLSIRTSTLSLVTTENSQFWQS